MEEGGRRVSVHAVRGERDSSGYAGFGDGRRPQAGEYRLPPEAGKGTKADFLLELLKRNGALSSP